MPLTETDIMEHVNALFARMHEAQEAARKELKETDNLDCKGCNPHLVARQKLTQADIDAVTFEHERKNILFKVMSDLNPVEQKQELQLCALELQEIEFAMQRAWRFAEDADRHTWWFQAPHCRCPSMDNSDPIMPNRITVQNCPLHGWN